MIVKLQRDNGTPLYINSENIEAVAVNGVVDVIYIGMCIDPNDTGRKNKIILTLSEAQPLLDVLEMQAAETSKKIRGFKSAQQLAPSKPPKSMILKAN
jgi:hypothetical protein